MKITKNLKNKINHSIFLPLLFFILFSLARARSKCELFPSQAYIIRCKDSAANTLVDHRGETADLELSSEALNLISSSSASASLSASLGSSFSDFDDVRSGTRKIHQPLDNIKNLTDTICN